MHCPFCQYSDSRVLDSRVADDGASIRRRRQCQQCGKRFTTTEQIQLSVIKRSGVSEPFDRQKVISGVRKACKGRPVSEDQLAQLGQHVETTLRSMALAQIPTEDVGVAILEPLKTLDAVAYLRFASIYKNYQSAQDFIDEIERMELIPPSKYDQGSAPLSDISHRLDDRHLDEVCQPPLLTDGESAKESRLVRS